MASLLLFENTQKCLDNNGKRNYNGMGKNWYSVSWFKSSVLLVKCRF